jgi:hypothetical protein
MFLVDDTIEGRQSTIRAFVEREPVIAVLLAAADFEWTARRAILALGKSSTTTINTRFENEKRGGLNALKRYWRDEVEGRLETSLQELIPNWDQFVNKAYPLRHQLIHGARGSTGVKYAGSVVETFLAASKALADFADQHHEPIFGRRLQRRKSRT